MRANSILFVGLLSVAARPSVAIPFGDAFSAASGLVSRAAAYSFDIYQGFTLQQQLSSKNSTEVTYTTEGGRPYFQPYGAQRIGQDGPLLLQDTHLIDSLAHFARERIPERVVHARGAGAHGFFEVTTDFAEKYSMADVFKKGTRTSASVRFSTVGGAQGSADEARDPRGFAIKLRSKKGILDWVFNNTPVFFIRDPNKFPHFIHTQKTDPQTHLRDKNMFWDYLSLNEESMLQTLRLLSDLGTPYGFRHMHGWSGHTYRLVKEDGSWVYVRVYLETDQGVKNFTNAEATKIAGENAEFATQDLFESIEKGNYPSWTVYFQVMTAKEAESYRWNILDLTKDWLNVTYHEVGKLTLTQNPINYFAEIEQAAFSPANTVDGWEPSADPVLQSRLFSYNDAHRYRLGVNYQQMPVNCPFSKVANFERDGAAAGFSGNQGKRPNYISSEDPIDIPKRPYVDDGHLSWTGGAVYYLSTITDKDFEQPRNFWLNQLDDQGRKNLVSNIVGHLGAATDKKVQKRTVDVFAKIHPDLANGVAERINITA